MLAGTTSSSSCGGRRAATIPGVGSVCAAALGMVSEAGIVAGRAAACGGGSGRAGARCSCGSAAFAAAREARDLGAGAWATIGGSGDGLGALRAITTNACRAMAGKRRPRRSTSLGMGCGSSVARLGVGSGPSSVVTQEGSDFFAADSPLQACAKSPTLSAHTPRLGPTSTAHERTRAQNPGRREGGGQLRDRTRTSVRH